MLMFALISAATTFALQAAIGGQRAAHRKADEIQEARTVLAIMSRDFRGAYASKANPNTFFVSSGSDTAPSISFTSLTHRLFAPLTDSSANPVDPTTIPPQSDVSVIHYSYDPSTAELGRIETSVPNPDLINQLDTLGSTGNDLIAASAKAEYPVPRPHQRRTLGLELHDSASHYAECHRHARRNSDRHTDR